MFAGKIWGNRGSIFQSKRAVAGQMRRKVIQGV